MAARIAAAHKRQGGFTLIELLVVILILGILAGIVVFAVRGADDKGQANAIATERRIIRTALEAYCAQKGTYPEGDDPIDVLVQANFLSGPAGYHDLFTGTKGEEFPEGKCGTMGYRLDGGGGGGVQDPPPSAKCFQVDDAGTEVEVPVQSGRWCLAATPKYPIPTGAHYNNLVRLASGEVLAFGAYVEGLPLQTIMGQESTAGFRTEIFDPAAGPKGSWRDGAIVRTNTTRTPESITLIEGTFAQCDDRCGMVLAAVPLIGRAMSWQLFDPDGDDGVADTTGAWQVITEGIPDNPVGDRAVQLLGPGCDPHCGKVLTVGYKPNANGMHFAELYDPKENRFGDPISYGLWNEAYRDPHLAELSDGRVLLYTRGPGSRRTFLLDLELGIAEPMIVEPQGAYLIGSQTAVLPGGGVLFLYYSNIAEIYHSEALGQGRWERLARTCSNDPSLYCHHLATLPDGRVLVNRNGGTQRGGNEVVVFDSTQTNPDNQWTDTAGPNDAAGIGFSVLLSPSRGPCGTNCNRVLSVGLNKAEFYVP